MKAARTILIVTIGVFCFMCTKQKPERRSINLAKARDSVEAHLGKHRFSPFIGSEKHLAIRFRIKDGKIITAIDTSSVKEAFGKMPRTRRSGNFEITLMNKRGKVLSYYINNPFYIRVESGANRGIRRISNGSFYVRVPKGKGVTHVIFKEENGQRFVSDVSDEISHFQ